LSTWTTQGGCGVGCLEGTVVEGAGGEVWETFGICESGGTTGEGPEGTKADIEAINPQVALSWLVQRGNWSVVPKSANPERMAQNLEVSSRYPFMCASSFRADLYHALRPLTQIFKLSEADFEALSAVHNQPGKLMYSCDYGSGDIVAADEIFGWSLSDMGWEKLD